MEAYIHAIQNRDINIEMKSKKTEGRGITAASVQRDREGEEKKES